MKEQASLVLLLSLSFFLQGRVLTIFPGFSTGRLYNGKLNASKIFWGVPCLSSLLDNWLYQVYHRVEAISFGQKLVNVQLAELTCYFSQMPCVLLVPVACATGRHRQCLQTWNWTGAALVRIRAAPLRLMETLEWNVRCAKQKREQNYSFQPLMNANVFYLSINTFFNCIIYMENKDVQVWGLTLVQGKEDWLLWGV